MGSANVQITHVIVHEAHHRMTEQTAITSRHGERFDDDFPHLTIHLT